MAKSNRHQRNRRTKKKEKFLLARTNIFLKSQLIFQDTEDDIFTVNTTLKTTPSVALYDNGTKLMFDYSHSNCHEDMKKISAFFTKSNYGTSFTISDGKWQHILSDNYDADFSGNYTFNSIENGNIILATIGSGVSTSSKFNSYIPENFLDVPQITISIPTNETEVSIVKNILGKKSKKSFYSLGIDEKTKPGTMWISVGGSELNTGKHQIKNYSVDSEGVEILQLEGSINEEAFSDDGMLIVNVFVKDTEDNKNLKSGPLSTIQFQEKVIEEPTTNSEPIEELLDLMVKNITTTNNSSTSSFNGNTIPNTKI